MREWIVPVVLYVLGMALFHLLGGLGAAADTLKRWGQASSTNPEAPSLIQQLIRALQ